MFAMKKFIIAIVIQLVIIFSVIVFKIAVLTGGTEVLLRIKPIVFRKSLRGNYLTISYEISNLNSYFFNYFPIRNGDTVYVPLVQQGKYWVARSGIGKMKPIDERYIFLKGKVLSTYGNSVNIVYDIEEYFIPEGISQDFTFWRQEVAARVSIDENGNAVLKQIYINNKPWP